MSETVLTNMVMLEENNKVLVINRKKKYQGIAFPGGKAEKGESIYNSALREFQEETGLLISNLKLAGFFYWEGEDEYKYFVFCYKGTTYSGTLNGGTEEGEVFWLEKDKLKEAKLAPHMEEYLRIFEDDYSEVHCSYKDQYLPHIY